MAKRKKMFKSTYGAPRVGSRNVSSLKINKTRLSAAIIVFLAVCVGGYFLYMNTGHKEANLEELMQSGRFIQGITVNQVPIGGMTYSEAGTALDPVEFQKAGNFKLTVSINEDNHNINGNDINIDTNLEETLSQALLVGQSGNRGERKKEKAKIKKEGRDFQLRYTYDNDLMEQQLTAIQKKTGLAAQDATVKIEGGEIIYIEGKKGIKIDKDKLEADIHAAMDQGHEQFVIQAQTIEVEPSITVQNLKDRLVRKSVTTTEFKSSTAARASNVVKAAGLLNGEMIPAGGTFSINAVLGARTSENGWSVATAIASGKYIDDVGGGVCQVSSTLYSAAIKAGVDVIARQPHTYPVSYLPVGQDAAISTGGPDLKLRNNYDFPIYIVAYASSSSRTLDVMIYGPKNEDGGTYIFKSNEVKNEEPTGKASTTVNNNLLEGEYVELKPRKNLIVAERWVEYVINGQTVRTEKMSTDTYSSSAGEYAIGPGTEVNSKTGRPKGKKVSEEYLTKKREKTTESTSTKETEATTSKTTDSSKTTDKSSAKEDDDQ